MKTFYFPNDEAVDSFFNDGDPICFDEKELDRLCAEWGEEIREQVHEASLAEIDRYGTYEHEEEEKMKTYYLVYDHGTIFVHDSVRWERILMEIQAESYIEAQSRLKFQLRAQGKTTTMQIVGSEVKTETI